MTEYKGMRLKRLWMIFTAVLAVAAVVALLQAGANGAFYFTAAPLAPNTDTQIKLDWSPVNGAVVYELEKRDGPDSTVIASIDINQSASFTSYVDTGTANAGLTPETSYVYTLHAYSDTAKQSEIPLTGNIVSASTTKMIKPAITSVKYNINTREVTLSWSHNSKAAAGAVIRQNNESGTQVASLNTTDTTVTFRDLSLISSTMPYVVISRDLGGHLSDASQPVDVTPIPSPAVTAVVNQGVARITWDSFPSVAQFNLERSRYNSASGAWGDWQIVNSQLATGATYADNTPASGGTYRYRLNAKPEGSYLGYIMSQPVSKPVAPTDLEAVIITKNQIDLKWVNNADNPCKYKIERKTDSSTYSTLGTIDEFENSYSVIDNFVINTTYTYRVTAFDSSSNYSSSKEIAISTSVPLAPTGLSLVQSSTSMKLTWNDNSNSESGFYIERKEGTGDFERLGTVAYNTNTFTDTTMLAGHAYTYRVNAWNPFGNSIYSNEITSSASAAIIPPSSLSAVAASSSQIDLSWAYADTGNYSTAVERKTGTDGAWSRIYTSAVGVLKYSDTGLAANTQYYYRVRNVVGTGVYSIAYPNTDTGVVGTYTMFGGLPLSGTAASSNRILLSWSGNPGNADIIIERKMASGNFAALATVSASTVSWYDTTGLVPGASYIYRIKAKNSSNESVYSNEVTVINLYLEAPTGLTASAGGDNKITLSWTDNSPDETGFEIWRYIYGSGTYQFYASVDANTTKYTDANITAGVQYNYMVRAFKQPVGIYSAYTASAGAGIGLLIPPSNLKYSVLTNGQVLLSWQDNSNNESGFRVERRLPGETVWTTLGWLSANTTAYTVYDMPSYVRYIYRVRVYSTSGNFDSFSDEIEVSTGLPIAASDVTAQAISATQVVVKWTDNAYNEICYRIERRLQSSATVHTFQVDAGVTQFTDSGLYPNSTYLYKIIAVNNTGSIATGEVSVLTMNKAYFQDITTSFSWAKEAIENLAGRGVFQGKTANQFKPNDKITRAEFTAIMMRAFKLDGSTPVGSMADVKVGKWYYKEVMIAENLGIVSPDSTGKFYPEKAITREEMAVILTRTLAAVDKPLAGYGNSVLEKYWDKSLISPAALSSMASVAGDGVMTGKTATSIAPKDNATRAEAAVILYRVIDR